MTVLSRSGPTAKSHGRPKDESFKMRPSRPYFIGISNATTCDFCSNNSEDLCQWWVSQQIEIVWSKHSRILVIIIDKLYLFIYCENISSKVVWPQMHGERICRHRLILWWWYCQSLFTINIRLILFQRSYCYIAKKKTMTWTSC